MRKKFFSFLILVLISGFFTPFNQLQAIGETLGYTTSIDIYLDVDNPSYVNGQMFNWTSATRAYDPNQGNCSGAHDFVFSCGFSETKKFICTATNDVNYLTPEAGPVLADINKSGWYNFKHSFYNDGTGVLLVKMDIIDKSGTNFGHWELRDPAYRVGENIGGNRHGMFFKNSLGVLAIDEARRTEYTGDVYYQSFESSIAGWFDTNPFSDVYYRMTNIASGTDGITASHGSFYTAVKESFTSWGEYSYETSCAWPVTPNPVREAEIISPTLDQVISGSLSLEAKLYNDNSNDGLDWWVKFGSCSETGAAKIGNVGVATVTQYNWDNNLFTASDDTSTWAPGKYCFIFDPKESLGESPIRLERDFSVIDNIKPEVMIITPADGAEVKGTVTIQASASDANLATCRLAVKTVKDEIVEDVFSQTYLAADCAAGISYDWNTNTTLTPDGNYTIAFQAFDSSYIDDTNLNNWSEDVHIVSVKNTTTETPPEDVCLRPYDKDDCKKGGWKLMDGYDFKNQGDCVSFLESAYNAHCYKY